MRILLALCAISGAASCSQWDLGVEIPVIATWHGQALDCHSEDPALTDLRLFISRPQLLDADGRAHDVRFATEFEWQNDAVAFVDLETGNGACSSGTQQIFDRLIGVARAGDYRGLRFTIGVPFRLNHENPQTAGPPLNDPDMHADRRSGYLFLRAGVRTADDAFRVHGGSAGCEGEIGNITACRFPNRIEVFLPDFVPGEHAIALDMAALLEGTNLADGVPTDCDADPSEPACIAPFAALGIDFASGRANGPQRVFSAR